MVLVALAGCLSDGPAAPDAAEGVGPASSGPGPPDDGPAPGDPTGGTDGIAGPAAYTYACGGSPLPLAPAPVCASLATVPGQVLAEPYVALHPTRPEVVALGVNSAGPDADGSPDPSRPLLASSLLLSEDAGAAWRVVPLPPLPADPIGAAGSFGDPAVAFTPAGTLLFAGLLCDGSAACDIVAAASPDLGATWSAWSVVAGDGDNDREWFAIGRDGTAYLSWTSGTGSEVAASRDDGASWATVARAEDCIGASPVAELWGAPHVACVNFRGDGPEGIRILGQHGSPAWATAERHDGLDMVWPRLHAQGPVLVLEDYRNSTVAVRWWDDGAGAWGPIVDVRKLVAVEDGWTRAFTHWDAVDAWGRLHLVLGGEPAGPLAGPPDRMASAFAHVVLHRGGVVQEQALTTDPPLQAAALPGHVVLASDYAGLAFAGSRGVLAWPAAGGIAVSLLEAA